MPVSKAELLALLKDPQVLNYLRSQVVQQASVTGVGRYPGQGSAQNDNYVYPDAADATFPYNFDYEIPGNFQRLVSAKLSFRIRPYRTYSTLTLSATGNASNDHTHGMSHTHSHNHTWHIGSSNLSAATMWSDGLGNVFDTTVGASNIATTTDATGSSAANTGGQSATHTHSVSGTTTLGIAEDAAPVNPGITVSIDGSDVTAAVGGPFNGDLAEIDVTQVLKTAAKVWHTLSLQPNQRVRITGILRISYYVDSRLAQ